MRSWRFPMTRLHLRTWTATGSLWVPRRRRWPTPGSCRWGATFRCSCTLKRARNTRWRAPSAKPHRAYHGFAFHTAPGVTLEDDLARRDLTINAMAVAAEQSEDPARGEVMDPYGGRRDLRERVLRHVTTAFAEDPVRILRLARFARALPRLLGGTGNHGPDAADGGRRRGGSPRGRARVARALSRGLMEQRPRPHAGGAARIAVRCSACCPKWTGSGACRSAPTTTPKWTPACTC